MRRRAEVIPTHPSGRPPLFPSTHWSVLLLADGVGTPALDWAAFARAYQRPVEGWFVSRGVQAADASDLTQRFLVRLHASFPTYRREHGDFRPWLVVVLTNLLHTFHREQQRRPDRATGGPDGWDRLAAPESADDLLSAVQSAGQRWMAAAMAAVEAKVQPNTWRAFVAHAVNGQPAPEVAAALGMTVTAVHTARYRTLKLVQAEYLRIAAELTE